MSFNSTPGGNIVCMPLCQSAKRFSSLAFLLILSILSSAQSGSLNRNFGYQGVALTTLPGADPDYSTGWTKVLRQSSGNLITIASYSPEVPVVISSFSPAGKLNTWFGSSGFVKLSTPYPFLKFAGITICRDDKILVGFTIIKDGKEKFLFRRYHPNGRIDHSYGHHGTLISSHGFPLGFLLAANLALQPDGKIMIASAFWKFDENSIPVFTDYYDVLLIRFTREGHLDHSFSDNGLLAIDHRKLEDFPAALQVLHDGKILVAFQSGFLGLSEVVVMRLEKNGRPDHRFGDKGKKVVSFGLFRSYLRDMIIQKDGKILLGGDTSPHEYYNAVGVARLLPNGQFDNSFGDGGKKVHFYKEGEISSECRKMVLQENGNIWITGAIYRPDFMDYTRVVIGLDKYGRVNKGFGTAGVVEVPQDFGSFSSMVVSGTQLVVAGVRDLPYKRALLAAYDLRTSIVCPDALTTTAPLSNEKTLATTWKAYPNPASQQLTLTVPLEIQQQAARYSLYDRSGVLVKQGVINGATTILPVGNFTNGLYELVVWSSSGAKWNQKIVVQH